MDRKDIYHAAELLIQQHGKKAETVANTQMERFMDEGDVATAALWLSICQAIHDIRQGKTGVLH